MTKDGGRGNASQSLAWRGKGREHLQKPGKGLSLGQENPIAWKRNTPSFSLLQFSILLPRLPLVKPSWRQSTGGFLWCSLDRTTSQCTAQEDGEQFLYNCPAWIVTCLIKFAREPHLCSSDWAFSPLVCENYWNPVMVTTYCSTKGRWGTWSRD